MTLKYLINSTSLLALVACGMSLPATGANAADAATGASAAAMATTDTGLEEIMVTARKRKEDLQTLSTSIAAIGKAELDRRFDVDLRDFVNVAPNVQIDDLQQGPGSPAAMAIRGIGTTDVEKSFDPAVGVVVDGIFIGANSGAMIRALDVERVEVLNGPQGTLFGRNSIAGVINITRSEPQMEFGGRIRAGYGNYNDTQLDGYVNIPVIADKVAVKIGGAKRRHDGYFYDITTNKQVGYEDFRDVNASILVKPTDNIKIMYRFERTKQDQDANTLLNMAQPTMYVPGQGTLTTLWGILGDLGLAQSNHLAQSTTVPETGPNRYIVAQNTAPSPAWFKSTMHILNASWDITPDYRIDYLYGHFNTSEAVYQQWDATNELLYATDRPATYKQDSHELRLTHSGSGPLSFVLGGYYWKSSYRIDLLSYIGFAVPGLVITVPQTAAQKTESIAGFFEGDYKFTDQLTLTLGGRYTHDKKTAGLIDASIVNPDTGMAANNLDDLAHKSWSQFTPKVSLKYQATPDAMVYALFSTGFRAGGYSGRPGTWHAATTAYNPEKVKNFELGFKSEWLDRRLRINGAAFLMKYTDKQEELNVPIVGGTGEETRVLNAGKAEIKGIELDVTARVAEGLTINGNIGLLDAKYTDFTVPTETGPLDLSYLHLRRAPKMTSTINVTYEHPMFGGKGWVQGSWHRISSEDLTFANSPQGHNGAQNIVDASINFKIHGTSFSIYGRNLTKEDAWTQAYDVSNLWTYASPRNPRTYGFRIIQDF